MADSTSSPSHKLEHTPSGTPYIALKTRSQVPIYLTQLKESDAEAMQQTIALESVGDVLIGTPKPYTLDSAKWWINQQRKLPLQIFREKVELIQL